MQIAQWLNLQQARQSGFRLLLLFYFFMYIYFVHPGIKWFWLLRVHRGPGDGDAADSLRRAGGGHFRGDHGKFITQPSRGPHKQTRALARLLLLDVFYRPEKGLLSAESARCGLFFSVCESQSVALSLSLSLWSATGNIARHICCVLACLSRRTER